MKYTDTLRRRTAACLRWLARVLSRTAHVLNSTAAALAYREMTKEDEDAIRARAYLTWLAANPRP